MRRLTAVLMIALAASALASCGEKHDATAPRTPRPFDLVLDFFPNADHAGIYAAIASGEFRRAGLNVVPRVPSDPSAPLKLVAAGRADMAISYEPELLLARERGLHLISVGALAQQPLTSIIALGDRHISSVRDLAGKRVGTAGIPYQSAYLKTILGHAGVDPASVQETSVGFNLVPAHKVDATLGGFWNYEGIQLALAHRNPTVIHVDRAGVPTYDELVLVVREQDARRRGAQIRAFMQALGRGEAAVRANPSAAVDQLVAANRDLDRRLQLASIHHSIAAFYPADASRPFGYQDPRAWDAFGQWMLSHHLLTRPPIAASALTNEFLAGQGI